MARKGGHGALARSVKRGQPDIVDRRLQALFAYWEKERGDRALPSRHDIDPAALRFVLGHLILLDVLRDPIQFRIRLQGTELEWWMGGDLTGQTLDQLRSPGLSALAHQCLTTVIETRVPFHKIGEETIGDLPRHYEALLLPLASDGVSVNMVLAAVLCRDDRARS
jgi:hypothetical protein